MRPLMVLGCTSDAGKSFLATALCRWFARRGVRVAPFKAQNMSNNARVVDGGEIGVAQWLQAKAAGVEPDVRMNPVLLKPEAQTRSQVIVRGRLDRALSEMRWEHRHDAIWEPMASSFDELRREFDLVVIEGAGSPAEINLRDQVNNRIIHHADASGVLVSDIDRGGAFAHLFGTWSLVPDETRRRLDGFVLNRFRGDPTLLAPGPEQLAEMTSMAPVGVIPMVEHDLPREEGFASRASSVGGDRPTVVAPRLPFGSNLDEFQSLATVTDVVWTDDASLVDRLDPQRDLVLLPGSKHVVDDLEWMSRRGWREALARAASRDVRVVGVCGGAMMLGSAIHDPDGLDGGRRGSVEGLDLLPIETTMREGKTVRRVTVRPSTGTSPTSSDLGGYEIRLGRVSGSADAWLTNTANGDVVGWRRGNIWATTVHGLFETADVVEWFAGRRPEPYLDRTVEQLADLVDEHLDTDRLLRMVDPEPPAGRPRDTQ